MELRDFRGSFRIDGRETDRMDLRILLTIGGGETHGSGAFRVPAAMIGTETGGPLTFVTEAGDEITVVVREFDLTQGVAYFLTEGEVPALPRARDAG
ncbi:hypothetical protein [Maritimibacter sp. UBA3975]|uniref:hypothetical protein n=1 Tax=Maritimibacter sp. UBA3975 TaxID=1946833 RepID=UPI000C0A15DA|nr:hypothetical protein [Maritimibacter sp. UBA3975]MAM60615.1 hypothetical protein [Maritimibacter sp.]|tara:strand:+ start:13932 stop:14222 length:291 start_codon:yes stop_codon:yes gene_type:complete